MTETQMNDTARRDAAQAFVDACHLKYHAEFIPQSQSRNAGDKHRSLNWRVTVGPITTDYTQGIAHIPGYQHQMRRTVYGDELERRAAETGRLQRGSSEFLTEAIPVPALVDVLYSLVSDADALEAGGFEDWANESGHDPDSRKAEAIYRSCLEIALKLRQVIDLDAARSVFEDY